MRSQYHRKKKWNIDEWSRKQEAKRKKENWKNLEVLELLNDKEKEKQRSDGKKKLKLKIVLCV